MNQLVRIDPGELDVSESVSEIRVRIQGLPEDVQRIADGVEAVFPGAMEWHSFVQECAGNVIEVSGTGVRSNDMRRDGFS